MTRILIAADETDASVDAARAAHRLFGDDAEYLVINVAPPSDDAAVAWAAVYPATMPVMMYPPEDSAEGREATAHAEALAAQVAGKAALSGAETVSDVGDVSSAIVRAAHEHHVDVVVVGSHDRSWFSKLFSPSVATGVLREIDIPVLVVK